MGDDTPPLPGTGLDGPVRRCIVIRYNIKRPSVVEDMSNSVTRGNRAVEVRRPVEVAGAILALLLIAGCSVPPPAPSVEASLPPDVRSVWTVQGNTADPAQTEATYFNDPGAPTLAPGALFVAWSCSGSGRLQITPSRVQGHGAVKPSIGPLTLTFQVACPSDPDPLNYTWKEVPGLLLGGENVVLIRPAIEPSGPMRWTVVFAQP